MLRRRGTYTVNAEPDNRQSRVKPAEPSLVTKKTGRLQLQFMTNTLHNFIVKKL